MTGLRTTALCGRSGPHAWQQRHLLHDNTRFSHWTRDDAFWCSGLDAGNDLLAGLIVGRRKDLQMRYPREKYELANEHGYSTRTSRAARSDDELRPTQGQGLDTGAKLGGCNRKRHRRRTHVREQRGRRLPTPRRMNTFRRRRRQRRRWTKHHNIPWLRGQQTSCGSQNDAESGE